MTDGPLALGLWGGSMSSPKCLRAKPLTSRPGGNKEEGGAGVPQCPSRAHSQGAPPGHLLRSHCHSVLPPGDQIYGWASGGIGGPALHGRVPRQPALPLGAMWAVPAVPPAVWAGLLTLRLLQGLVSNQGVLRCLWKDAVADAGTWPPHCGCGRLNSLLCPQNPPPLFDQVSAAVIQAERVSLLRVQVQHKHEEGYREALATIKGDLMQIEGPDIKESLREQIRQWFIECR